MARRVPFQLVAAALVAVLLAPAATPAATESGSVLASYSFDDTVAAGPDTFAIWQGARHTATGQGRVSLSTSFHVSGYRSVELRDVAGDGDFPELQGYFPARTTGRLFFHFAFLTTDPKEELNVALAGPRYFQMEKDGISFWLATREGQLVHISDSIPKKLFPVEAFVWYAVDLAYDLAAGTYALTIHREGQDAPLVALRDQPNTVKQAGSAVDKFSFVGSPYGDRSNVVYYVDDVVIGTDVSVSQRPFVAPGRRKLFIDRFHDYQKLLLKRPHCLPASGPEDVGFTAADLTELGQEGLLSAAERLLAGDRVDAQDLGRGGEGHARTVLQALADWNAGCAALEDGNPKRALPRFEKAAAAVPEGRIFSLSAALTLAGLKRFSEADERLALLSDWRDDPRYAVASAFVGIARGDLDRAEAWLRDPAWRVVDRDQVQDRIAETLLTEQYYYVQLWKGRYDVARDYALRMGERLRRAERPAGTWVGRAGDASFYSQDLRDARELYEQAIRGEKDHGVLMALYLKLADLAYLSGDLETERGLREHYYGALTE